MARIIQHPQQYPIYPVHLAWVMSLLLVLVHFWWWEFGLSVVQNWTFGVYLFIVAYAITLFLICALLFPESMQDYKGYEDFFYARRGWFFGLLALTYLLDIADTLIKGEAHFAHFGREYFISRSEFDESKLAFASTVTTRSRSSTGSAPATSPWIRWASTTPIPESSTLRLRPYRSTTSLICTMGAMSV